MRQLSPEEIRSITDLTADPDLITYGPSAFEKDLHLTEIIRALCTADLGGTLVFCGGTSLSKAFDVISRMSEDIDFKINLPDVVVKKSTRSRMGSIRSKIVDILIDLGFEVDKVQSFSESTHLVFPVRYSTIFPTIGTLRDYIQLEVVFEPNEINSVDHIVSTLLWRAASKPESELVVKCLALNQTVAEKITSFLRRYAATSDLDEFDGSLLRHIYDIYRLDLQSLIDTSEIRALIARVLESDSQKYGDNPVGFKSDPRSTLLNSLAGINRELLAKKYWNTFVQALVIGEAPSFDVAFASFEKVARQVL